MFRITQKPSGVLTFTTNGVTHLEILERFYEVREKEYKEAYSKGLRDAGKKESK